MWSRRFYHIFRKHSRAAIGGKLGRNRGVCNIWSSRIGLVLQLPKQARYTRLLRWIIRLGVFSPKTCPEEWYLEMTIFCDWVNTIQTALRPFHCPTWIILNQCEGDVKRKRENNPMVAEEHQELRYAFSEERLKSYYAGIWKLLGRSRRNEMPCIAT